MVNIIEDWAVLEKYDGEKLGFFQLLENDGMTEIRVLTGTKVANKLKNDRIRKIPFHILRHWKATTEYAKTKDILHVMKILGHKNIQNTLLYTQLITFQNDEFHSATAKNIEDAQKLIEAGFEYVCDFGELKLFRRRK